eukprot:TCONS_00004063-protein
MDHYRNRVLSRMNIEGTFIGSLSTTSNKLKQTVSLNRRTVSNLDHEIYRFKREKEKNTVQIKREKEKFLAKQSRLLPSIPKHREDELLLRNTKPRPKSSTFLPASYAASPPLCKRSDKLQKARALTLDLNKNVQVVPLNFTTDTYQPSTHKRLGRRRSRSLSDLPPEKETPSTIHPPAHRFKKFHNIVALKRWRKIRQNLRYLINLELVTNFSFACEKLKDCRYIRHRPQQEQKCSQRCFCNTCSVRKTRFVH